MMDGNNKNRRQQESDESGSYDFLKETIKPKPVSKKQVRAQILKTAICGFVFGIFACGGFYALKPWVDDTAGKDMQEVTIPEDDADTSLNETVGETGAQAASPELTADSYRTIMQSMYQTADEAEQSVVSVCVAEEDDEIPDKSGNQETMSGLITADNGRELLILVDNKICSRGSSWTVTFCDKSEYSAILKKQDENRGLAVFSVNRSEITEGTWSAIKTAKLGNSYSVSRGDVVIALGNMFGYSGGVGYGIVSSTEYDEVFSDGKCDVIATDIASVVGGTGFLFNQKGEMVGMIRDGLWEDAKSTTANALAISDLKSVLELLLNGESVPYVGVHGLTITAEISEQQDIPTGMYVTKVGTDSPAMAAGIQNGDILQKIDDTYITGTSTYEKAVLACSKGQNVKIQGKRRGLDGYVDVEFTVTVGSQE